MKLSAKARERELITLAAIFLAPYSPTASLVMILLLLSEHL